MSPKLTRTVVFALLTALVLLATGCQPLPPPAQERPGAAPIPLIVRNNHPLDVVIQAVSPGPWLRLGTVMSSRTDTLAIPYSVTTVGALRLALDPVGSTQRHPLGPIIVLPGDRIELTIEAYLPASSWRVLPRVIANVRE